MANKKLAVGRLLSVIVVAGILITALSFPFWAHTVNEGHVGVHKKWGAVTNETHEPGFHVINPVGHSVKDVEVRPRAFTMADTQGEGDKPQRQDAVVVTTVNGTTVRVDVTVRYRVEKDSVPRFVSQWNNVDQAEERLIRPTVRDQLRDEAAAIPTNEIYTSDGRQRLANAARQALSSEFSDEAMVLEAVQIRDVDLPKSYDEALNEKEIAKQRVQAEKNRLEQEKIRAEQKRVQAEAQADVVEIRGESLRENPIVLRAQYIESLGDGTVFVVPQGSDTPIIMDAGDVNKSSNSTNESWASNATSPARA